MIRISGSDSEQQFPSFDHSDEEESYTENTPLLGDTEQPVIKQEELKLKAQLRKALSDAALTVEKYPLSTWVVLGNLTKSGFNLANFMLFIEKMPPFPALGFGIGSVRIITALPVAFYIFGKSIKCSYQLIKTNEQLKALRTAKIETSNIAEYKKLKISQEKIKKELFGNLKEFPGILITLAQASIDIALLAGALFQTIAPPVMASLTVCATILGVASGGIGVVFGLVQSGLGVGTFIKTQNALYSIDRKVEELNSSTHSDGVEKNDIEILNNALIQQRNHLKYERIRTFLAMASGLFVTAGGACAIAAACTAPTVAGSIAFGAVGITAVVFVIGIQATSWLIKYHSSFVAQSHLELPEKLTLDQEILYCHYLNCTPESIESTLKKLLGKPS